MPVVSPLTPSLSDRVRVIGKFFSVAGRKWYVKGFTYGPFAPNRDGDHLPDRHRLIADFNQIVDLGANSIRLYHVPPRWLLDEAAERNLRVFIDVPWEKHRCFFEDWSAQEDARQRIRKTARLLGSHPGAFAISVANEIPKDIVRYYGHQRVERFLNQLIDIVKQESPQCLATYTNYPSTEFLQPWRQDFACFNVYLHDPAKLAGYLDRLQHCAGPVPLLLGEFGVDSIRNGQEEQARQLGNHVNTVFSRGLAGSFVFSFTDDWYTGGSAIDDWAFGVTTRQRAPKPAAQVVSDLWERVPQVEPRKQPRVSVVVCSYNGAATLDECLRSLVKLNYPNYEVILVDDGSKDNTSEIAGRFPSVHYIHQANHGLSVARNVGAQAATGEIVAYTDSDCVADEDWLMYLVAAMQDQKVDAIGGPNVPPPSDGWIAKCVAASPGGPSHVMSDDQTAEHVPGCNMAFRRDKLLAIGGFDARFRQAGDDVDICWRFMDAGMRIGYAPAALVWHHRRNTVRAYFKQQAGYGRSEAMLHVKHPHRFNTMGSACWKGIIYGEGAVGLPVADPAIHHGRFGDGLFQIIYRRNDYCMWGYLTLLEWHVLALFFLILSAIFLPLAIVSGLMWLGTLAAAWRSTRSVAIPAHMPAWCRCLVFAMHLSQPVVRAWHRYSWRLGSKRLPHVPADDRLSQSHMRRISRRRCDLYWNSTQNRGREELLAALQSETERNGFEANYESQWSRWDAQITGDLWHNIRIYTATEELGWPKKFTRARCELKLTPFTLISLTAPFLLSMISALSANYWATGAGLFLLIGVVACILGSQRRCLNTMGRLLWRSGNHAKLDNVPLTQVESIQDATPARQKQPQLQVAKYA